MMPVPRSYLQRDTRSPLSSNSVVLRDAYRDFLPQPSSSLRPTPPLDPVIITRGNDPRVPRPPATYTLRREIINTDTPAGPSNRYDPPPAYSFPEPPPTYDQTTRSDDVNTRSYAIGRSNDDVMTMNDDVTRRPDYGYDQPGDREPVRIRGVVVVRQTVVVVRANKDELEKEITCSLWTAIIVSLLGGFLFGLFAIWKNRQAREIANKGYPLVARFYLRVMWRLIFCGIGLIGIIGLIVGIVMGVSHSPNSNTTPSYDYY